MAIAPEGKSGNMILRFFTNYRSCRERSGNGGFDLKEINKDRIQPFQRRHWGSPQHFAGCTNHCVGTLTRNKWIDLKRTIVQLNQVTLSCTYSPSASFTKLIVMCSQSSPWPCIALSQLSETYVGDTWSTPKGSQPFCLPYQKCLR